jgi:hypothetical protein
MYSNASCNDSTDSSGNGDAGVFVSVVSGNLNQGPTMYDHNVPSSISWNTNGIPHLGKDGYPVVPLKVDAAPAGAEPGTVLGVTLYQTALKDENGEKLLYYPQKKLEAQAVLSGEAVPVLNRGIVTLSLDAGSSNGASATNSTANWVPGSGIKIAAGAAGVVDACAASHTKRLGSILATGYRTAINQTDQFAGAAGTTGYYAIVKIGI